MATIDTDRVAFSPEVTASSLYLPELTKPPRKGVAKELIGYNARLAGLLKT
jgi:hypothetical protein